MTAWGLWPTAILATTVLVRSIRSTVPSPLSAMPRLQIVVDHTLEPFDQVSSEIVQLSHDAGEQDQIDIVAGSSGVP